MPDVFAEPAPYRIMTRQLPVAVDRAEETGYAFESWVDLELGRQVARGLRGGVAWAVEQAVGLPVADAQVLIALGRACGESMRCEVSLVEISLRCSLPREKVGRAIDALCARKLIAEGKTEHEGRRVYLLAGGGG